MAAQGDWSHGLMACCEAPGGTDLCCESMMRSIGSHVHFIGVGCELKQAEEGKPASAAASRAAITHCQLNVLAMQHNMRCLPSGWPGVDCQERR